MSFAQFSYGSSSREAGSIYTDPQIVVEVRATWGGSWSVAPYLTCLGFMRAAAPAIGTANFEYRWGTLKREDRSSFSSFPFVDYRGYFVRVRPAGYGSAAWWTGIFDVDSPGPFGSDVPGGVLGLTAFELSHLLDRQIIEDAPALSGQDKVVNVEVVPTANERYERGRAEMGNRSSESFKLSQGAANSEKVFVFGGTERWTNNDLATMFLRRYTPQGVTFALGGLASVLSAIESVTPLAGRSVWSVLQDLIPRSRGLTCVIKPGEAVCTVEVGTVLESDLKMGEVTIPKNPSQVALDLRNSITIGALSITRMRQNKYDEFEVRGAPLLSCFTVGYADTTLEEGWSFGEDSLEAEYLEAASDETGYGDLEEYEQAAMNDAYRETDKFDEVWTKHRIPRDWDGQVKDGTGGGDVQPALLKCDENGEVTLAKAAEGLSDGKAADDSGPEVAFAPSGKALEPWLPLEHGQDYTTDPSLSVQPSNAEPVYRKPFAIVAYEEGQEAGEPGEGEEEGTPATDDKNCYCDRPHETVRDGAAHVFVYDREMALGLTVSPRHLYAGENFDYEDETRSGVTAEPSAYDPVLNYETLLATVALRMDGHLRVVTRNEDAPETNARRKIVYLQDAEYWQIVKDTVVDIAPDGSLLRSPGAVLRDDSDRLRQACALVAAWYGRERAALSVEIKQVMLPCLPGQLVVSAVSSDGNISIGTPVSSVAVDLVGRSVTVRTDWHELDVSRF